MKTQVFYRMIYDLKEGHKRSLLCLKNLSLHGYRLEIYEKLAQP